MSFIENLKKKATGILDDDFSGMNYDLMPPMTNEKGVVPAPGLSPDRKSPFTNPEVNPFRKPSASNNVNTNVPDAVKEGQKAFDLGEEQYKKIFGLTYGETKERWKDKGGFEGLMANPAFTLGLAIMKSSAKGEPISRSLLDNAVGAGAISKDYADRISARSGVMAPVTDDQRATIESVLAEDNYYSPDFLDRLKRGNQPAKYREALDSIYDRAEAIAKKESKDKGTKIRLNRTHIRSALQKLENEGKIKRRGDSFFGLRSGTIEATTGIKDNRMMGGPVAKDSSYVVGEKGPEIFTPKATGKVVSNDDSNVVAMLLDANPQLKNVSLDRATKILKNRFPDYF